MGGPSTSTQNEAPATSGDAIAQFEATCVGYQAAYGNMAGANDCMNVADRMRARKRQSATLAAQPTPDATEPSGPIRWVAATPSCRTDITISPPDNSGAMTLNIRGPITDGCDQNLIKVLNEAGNNFPNAHAVLLLDSPGGSVASAARFAAALGPTGMPAVVPPHAQCASACFLIFAAAQHKYASRSALIGVHSAAQDTTGTETTGSKAVTTDLARLCAALNVPPAIIGRMVTTPPGEVAWLSVDELASMGVQFVPAELEN